MNQHMPPSSSFREKISETSSALGRLVDQKTPSEKIIATD